MRKHPCIPCRPDSEEGDWRRRLRRSGVCARLCVYVRMHVYVLGERECVRACAWNARVCEDVRARLTWGNFVQEAVSATPESIPVTPATSMDKDKIVTSRLDIDKQVYSKPIEYCEGIHRYKRARAQKYAHAYTRKQITTQTHTLVRAHVHKH